MRYLKKVHEEGFSIQIMDIRVADFSYADWARCLFDRRSTTGYCMFLGETLYHEKERIRAWSLGLAQSQGT